MSWFNCAAIQDSCLCSTLHFLFPVFVGCCLSAPQHNSNLTNEVRVAVVNPGEGKFHGGCRLTTFVPSCLYKTKLVGVLEGGGARDNNNILFQGRASHRHVCRSCSSHIFQPRPHLFLLPNRSWSDPKIHTLGRVGRLMNAACNHKQKQTLTFTSLSTSSLASTHTHNTHSR